MKATLVSKEKNLVKFTMEFTAEEFEAEQNKAYQKSKNQFSIDGFRKGKAPRSIIERHYGESIFFEDAIDNLLQLNYGAALEALDLDVINYPTLEPYSPKKGEPLTLTLNVEVYPEIEVKDYKGVEIDKVKTRVTAKEVDEEIENLQKRNARMVNVERPIENDDTVLLDYEGYVGDEQFEGGTAERYPLKIGSGTFIPGFEEQLIGHKAGEDVDVTVTFPEDYHADNLKGQEAVFKCKIHEVKEQELPEIDDEFVKDVSEYDTLEELKKETKKDLKKKAEEDAEMQMKDEIIKKIYEANDIDIPEAMVNTELDSMFNEFDQQLRAQGLDLNSYLEYMGKTQADFRNESRDDAYKKVKTRMIMAQIAEQENIEVTKEDTDKELEAMAAMYQMDLDQLKEAIQDENLDFMSRDIKIKKAVDFVYDNADIKK